MLRSLSENLLNYTCEGVLIRDRYVRQLDDIKKVSLAAKHAAKKLIRDTNKKLSSHHDEIIRKGYSEGLNALLGDLLRFFSKYQRELLAYEMKQRDLISNTIAEYFQSPEMQVELIKRLMEASPLNNKLTLHIPQTLQPYLKEALCDKNVELITHNKTTLSINAGSQILFFDPPLFMQDLKTQFHQPYSEKTRPVLTKEIKEQLSDYIQQFDELDNDDENIIKNEKINEN